jgi:hypothetical protein
VSSLTSTARRSAGFLLDAAPQRWRDRAFRALAPRVSDQALLSCHVIDQNAVLRHLAGVGFVPDAIIDVGAYVGEWSASATEIFPGLPTLMIDGNPSGTHPRPARHQ